MKPDHVILWVGPDDFAGLPSNVTDLTSHGLEIFQTPDIGPYTKIIPALDQFPDAFIATADDDIYYWPRWLEELIEGRDNLPDSVPCHRAHEITAGADGVYKSYGEWKLDTPKREKKLSLFPTGVGGILYPPRILTHTKEDRDAVLSLCPRADDIGLYWFGRRNGALYKRVSGRRELIQWAGSQNAALWASNVMQGGNDKQIEALAARYGYPAIDEKPVTAEASFDREALKRNSVRGVAVNFSSQLVKFVVQFGYQIAIMRLLAPADFGLVAMTAPVLVFVQMFTDFGLSQSVVQRDKITQSALSFLFWFNVVVSGALSLVTIALAPLAGLFYHEPRVTSIVMVLGVLLFLSGLQALHNALLNRRMAYAQLAAINLVSLVSGVAVGIGSALAGAGYWSLVFNQVAASMVSLALAWTFTRWGPNWPARPAKSDGIRDMLGFGGNVTGFNVVNFFARNLDNILIGRVWGEAPLGLYDRAYKLLLLPLNQIVWPFSSVALPTLSRSLHEPALYRRAFLRMMQFIILCTYPGIIFAMCTSRQLIVTVLGSRWEGVAPIFSILAFSGLFASVNNATGWLFISQNRTGEMRNWGIVSSMMFVLSFVMGLPWGPIGVAASYAAFSVVQGPMVWWASTKQGPVSLNDIWVALFPFCLGGLAVFATMFGLDYILPVAPFRLVILFIAAYAVFIGILAFRHEGRALFTDLREQLRHLSKRRKTI